MDKWSLINKRLQIKKDYEAVFTTEEGRRVLSDLMKTANIPKRQAVTDPNSLLVQEGMQIIIYKIFKALKTDPQALIDVIEQQYNEHI